MFTADQGPDKLLLATNNSHQKCVQTCCLCIVLINVDVLNLSRILTVLSPESDFHLDDDTHGDDQINP